MFRGGLFCLVAVGCATTGAKGPSTALALAAHKQAAAEWNCSEANLTLTELGDEGNFVYPHHSVRARSIGVEGCGRRAHYHVSCVQKKDSETCTVKQTATSSPESKDGLSPRR